MINSTRVPSYSGWMSLGLPAIAEPWHLRELGILWCHKYPHHHPFSFWFCYKNQPMDTIEICTMWKFPAIQYPVYYGVTFLSFYKTSHTCFSVVNCCFLLESNVLYRLKCQCADIFHCYCEPQNKCDIVIIDFDSVKPFSASCATVANCGTKYYRSPEVYNNMSLHHIQGVSMSTRNI